jgi:hypothetical protein
MVEHASNPRSQEAEAEGTQIPSSLLDITSPSQNK